jgi:hypothetical protein
MRKYNNARVKKILVDAGLMVHCVSHKKDVYNVRMIGTDTDVQQLALKVKKAIQEYDFGVKAFVTDYRSDKNKGHIVKFHLQPNKELVETKNFMTGEVILIPADIKGTCCDPGTETYWSM